MVDLYTKSILTVIAVCLILITVRDVNVVSEARASSGGPVEVKIVEISSRLSYSTDALPVKIITR